MRVPVQNGIDPDNAPPMPGSDEASIDVGGVVRTEDAVRQLNAAAHVQIERAERTLRLIHSGEDEPSDVRANAVAPMTQSTQALSQTGRARTARRFTLPLVVVGALALVAVAGVAQLMTVATSAKQLPHSDDVRTDAGAKMAEPGLASALSSVAMAATAQGRVDGDDSAAVPVALTGEPGVSDLGQAIYAPLLAKASDVERQCLARAIYYEARGEPYEGQVAVAQVVVNRVRAQRWPASICGVVHQGEARGEKCQFSFVCQRGLTAPNGPMWDEAQALAGEVVAGRAWLREAVEATHYHTTAVTPIWRQGLVAISTIGNHIFYREPGGLDAASKAYAPESAALALAVSARLAEAERVTAARLQRAKAAAAKPKLAEGPKAATTGGQRDSDWKLNAFGN